jgi:MFS family permease
MSKNADQSTQFKMSPMLWFLAIFNCSLAAFFVIYEFILRVLPSSMTGELIHAFHTDGAGIGWFSAAFLIAYSIMQIPVGVILDKYSPRVVLTFAITCCAIGSIFLAYADHLVLAFLSRFLIGFGAGFAMVGVYFLISHWFPREYYAFMTGMVQFMASLGAILGQVPIAMLLNSYSWRSISIVLGCIGLVMAIIYALAIRGYPKNHVHCAKRASTSMLKCVSDVVKKPRNWLVSSQALFTWGPMSALASLWGIPYLEVAYDLNATEASSQISACWIGFAIGSPILGISAKYIKSSLMLIWVPLIGVFISIIILYVPGLSLQVLFVLLFIFGFCVGIIPLSFLHAVFINPRHLIGTVTGLVNTILILGGSFMQPLVGWLLSFESPGIDPSEYSAGAYQWALIVLPLSWLISSALGLLIHKTEKN